MKKSTMRELERAFTKGQKLVEGAATTLEEGAALCNQAAHKAQQARGLAEALSTGLRELARPVPQRIEVTRADKPDRGR